MGRRALEAQTQMSKNKQTVADLLMGNKSNKPTGGGPANPPSWNEAGCQSTYPVHTLGQQQSSKLNIWRVSLTLDPNNVEIVEGLLLYKTQVVAFSERDVPNVIGLRVRKE